MKQEITMSEDTLVVEQPFDGAAIDTVALSDWSQADVMLDRSAACHADRGGWLADHERIAILKRLAGLVAEQEDAFALLIAREGGKPLKDAKVEVARAINGIELAAEGITGLHGQEIPMGLSAAGAGRVAFTRREPIGPVVAISAFNHPLNLIVHQVAPAIAAGCPIIIKPANTTPLCCQKFVDLLLQAGLPEPMCQLCICDNQTAEQMVTDPRVAFFSFIGSARVGWYLRSKLAPGTRCALEHGGAAPNIICKDADVGFTAKSLAKGGYYHAGQVCVSAQRLFVDNEIRNEFEHAFRDEVKKLVTGDPTDINTDVGPLILPREVERVHSWVTEATSQGTKILTGGAPRSGRVYEPTILVEPPLDIRVSNAEIFGPVTCLYGFDDVDRAVSVANSIPLAFQSAIYTRDLDRALHLAENLNASAVMVNDHSAFRTDWMPFAGRGVSGLGVGGIHHTMRDMTQEKMTVIRPR
jgi:acyl-CoA reductase-like NAD-dependent aldehyde dehydrogenase